MLSLKTSPHSKRIKRQHLDQWDLRRARYLHGESKRYTNITLSRTRITNIGILAIINSVSLWRRIEPWLNEVYLYEQSILSREVKRFNIKEVPVPEVLWALRHISSILRGVNPKHVPKKSKETGSVDTSYSKRAQSERRLPQRRLSPVWHLTASNRSFSRHYMDTPRISTRICRLEDGLLLPKLFHRVQYSHFTPLKHMRDMS
jgi:hypothetical protein